MVHYAPTLHRGQKKREKGKKNGKKEEEDREKEYDDLVNISSSQKINNFIKKEGEEKGKEIFTNNTQK